MIWATLFGYLVWGHVPGVAVIVGGVIVVMSGVYITHLYARRSKLTKARSVVIH